MQEHITILHTNDLHSHLERWPKIRRYLLQKQTNLRQNGVAVFTFDIGDFIDRAHPLTEATMGQANTALMNQVHYDTATIGNNEILGLAHEDMNHLHDAAEFPVLLGDITDMQTGELPKWAVRSVILTTPKGTRVGVLGMTAPFILTLPLLGWMPEKLDQAMTQALAELAGKTDFNVLLSHLGLPTDHYLAERFPDLQVIIGAHTHHHLPHGEKRGSALLAAAGKYGEHIGRIDLEITDGTLTKMQATTVDTDALPAEIADTVEIEGYRKSGREQLDKEVVAVLPTAYSTNKHADNRLIDLGLAALERRTRTTIAMLSTGMFLGDLPAGRVTKDVLHEILPHAIHPMRTTLQGVDLWRLVHEVAKSRAYMKSSQIRGMGFRGGSWGEIIWDGITLADNGDVYVHDELIDFEEPYTIGSLDHYYFLPFFPTIEIAGDNKMSYRTVFREDFADYLHEKFFD